MLPCFRSKVILVKLGHRIIIFCCSISSGFWLNAAILPVRYLVRPLISSQSNGLAREKKEVGCRQEEAADQQSN